MRKFKFMVFLMICLMAAFSGCAWLSPFSGDKAATQTNFSKAISDEKVQAPALVNGKVVILNNHKKTFELNRKSEEKTLNVWQKFCRWLGNLSILVVLVVIGGLLAGTSAPIVFLFNAYKRFKKGFVQTVQALDASGEVKPGSNLAVSLSKIQDSDVKALVDDIQQPGKV